MSRAVTCRGVVKRFGDVVAVDGVDLDVAPGSIHALLGPSGCGKTTLLRMVSGLEPPDAGSIAVGDTTLCGPDTWVPPELRPVGLVFQDGALFPHLTVAKNVAFGLRGRPDGEIDRRVAELLELVGLPDVGARHPDELSGGQRQRIALARALAPGDDVLLLDEPFSSLDARLRQDMGRDVRAILRELGTTALLVTHDRHEALGMADRVSVLSAGRLVQTAAPHDVYHRPADAEVAAIVGETHLITADASGATAESALGRVALVQPMQGAVRLLVRPEMLRLHEAGGVAARVLDVAELGDLRRVRLQLADGSEIDASVPSWSPPPSTGDEVRVAVAAPLWGWPA